MMKRSDLRPKNGKNKQLRRFLALTLVLSIFTALAFPDYGILPVVDAVDENVMPLATEGTPIAWFDFNGNTLNDRFGNNVQAEIEGLDNDGSADFSDLFKTEDGNTYLDLSGRKPYLSLKKADGSGVLKGLTEMTVEMRVRTYDSDTNWAFFAAPDENSTGDDPTYLGVLLKDKVKVERFANGRYLRYNDGKIYSDQNDRFYGAWDENWHTIRVVFKISSTILSVDGEVTEIGT